MTAIIGRGVGHPWTAEPGWDSMMLCGFETMEDLQRAVRLAKAKFWHEWFISPETLVGHMYKPSGRTSEWEDIAWQGTPRGHGHQFKVGDKVYTDFSSTLRQRRISQHTITGIEYRRCCQTGVVLRVTPPVRGSSFVADDGNTFNNAWIDAAWFRKDREDVAQ